MVDHPGAPFARRVIRVRRTSVPGPAPSELVANIAPSVLDEHFTAKG